MPYDLVSPFAPAGDQPRAIRELAAGLARRMGQAKLLLPIHDPSPAVWENIQTSLSSGKQSSGSNSPTSHTK